MPAHHGHRSIAPRNEIVAANFLDKNDLTVDQNALVVNTGSKLVLIDTGMGFRKIYGPRTGRLLANLRGAGIDPASVDVVALSHAHPDHVWGLVGADGKPNFPNAQIHIAQADLDYWTDEAELSDPALGHYIGPIRDALLPFRDRIVFVKDGQEVVPGMQALSTLGHTVGHTSFVISSQDSSIIYIGDLGHRPQLQMENPRAEFTRDTDPKQGVSSRLRVFDMVASRKIPNRRLSLPPGLASAMSPGTVIIIATSPSKCRRCCRCSTYSGSKRWAAPPYSRHLAPNRSPGEPSVVPRRSIRRLSAIAVGASFANCSASVRAYRSQPTLANVPAGSGRPIIGESTQ